MAILLFGQNNRTVWVDGYRGFNRLHGDSFIWTRLEATGLWGIAFGFNRLHGDSFIWTQTRPSSAAVCTYMFQSPSWRFFYLDVELDTEKLPGRLTFQSPSWRFFYLDVWYDMRHEEVRFMVSIAFMAILLFGPPF
mgnify:CR=1 FL=1